MLFFFALLPKYLQLKGAVPTKMKIQSVEVTKLLVQLPYKRGLCVLPKHLKCCDTIRNLI